MAPTGGDEPAKIRDLDTRLVRTFAAVARAGSFTRAADRLGLTQQGASGHVRRLESLLGCVLFERSRSRVELTRQGAALLAQANTLLMATDELFDSSIAETPRIRIAEIRGRRMMQECWRVHRRTYPGHRASFFDLLSSEQIKAVLLGQLDVGMGRLVEHVSGLDSAPLRLDAIQVMSIHPLNAASLRHSRLGYPGMVGDRFLSWSRFCEDLAADHGIELEKVPHDNTMLETIGQEQISGEIPPVLALNGMHDYPDSDSFSFHWLDDVQPYYPWSLFWRRNESRPEVRSFIETALNVADDRGWRSLLERDVPIWVPPDGRNHLPAS